MRVFAISGSLRAASTNSSLLRACHLVSPPGVEFVIYDGLATLPPFNPDLEEALGAEQPVANLRAMVQAADVVLISTPEYAHGLPGSLKNLLDWLVGSGELSGKPCALLNASARGAYAQASLREILTTMAARLMPEAEITLDLPGGAWTPDQIAADPNHATALRQALEQLRQSVSKAG